MLFYIAVAIGAAMCALGLAFVVVCMFQTFSLNNLQPAFQLATGLALFVLGSIATSLSIRIRWMRRVERKLDEVLAVPHNETLREGDR